MATTTKKSEEAEKSGIDYSFMNVYQKLQLARIDFLRAGVKKSGKNIKLEFMYFELVDIVPVAENIFAKFNLLGVTHFTADTGYMDVYDGDHPEAAPITFSAPFTVIQPIISSRTGGAVTNEMQALGSSITYMRRYLWQLVMDIIEIDTIVTNEEVIAWDMCGDGIVIKSDGKLHMLSGGDWEAQTNYCPMCGRKLTAHEKK